MLKVRKSIEIGASVSEVFAYMTRPENLLEVWPSLIEVSHVRESPNGGHSYDWVYKLAGVRIHGHAETVELEPERLLVVKNDKGIRSTFRWIFEGRGDTTRLTSDVDYEIPNVLAKLAERFVHKLNEREAETFLANVKARLEEGRSGVYAEPQPHA